MNEFTAKKLGEVLAFAEVGKETFERGLTAFSEIHGSDETAKLIEESNAHAEELKILADTEGVSEIVMKKLDATGTKLRAMRDMYVGDQWENPTELLEWSGFFEGAAVVHWSLVKGASIGISHTELQKLADKVMDFHQKLLDISTKKLFEVGNKKSV